MNVLDVCAGIGSFSAAAHKAGMNTVCQIEIDSYRQRVLQKHFPDARLLSDLTEVTHDDIPHPIDIICGGTPCTDLSIAGQRAGLAGKKSNLWFHYLRLIEQIKPQWVVWENVAGALSSNAGRDFLTILQGLAQCGYRLAWRVVDAIYWGIPQRRRRVFVIGHLTTGSAAQVLFESSSVPGTSQSRPETWKGTTRIAGTLTKSASGTARTSNGNEIDMLVHQTYRAETYDARNHRLNGDISGTLQAKATGGYSLNYINPVIEFFRSGQFSNYTQDDTAATLSSRSRMNDSDLVVDKAAHSFRMRGFGDYVEDDTASALKKRDFKDATDLVIDLQQVTSKTNQSQPKTVAGTLTSKSRNVTWSKIQLIRRLTPTECARLQGFPDDYLDDLGLSDTKQYEMWGDTIALPCSTWIMQRIAQFNS